MSGYPAFSDPRQTPPGQNPFADVNPYAAPRAEALLPPGKVEGVTVRHTSPKRKRGVGPPKDFAMPSDECTPPLPEPLAYFLTWTTYGTWLPGDQRGWVRRAGVFEEPSTPLESFSRQRQTEPACILHAGQQRIVDDTIAAHCKIRGWHLWNVRCLSNHVHVVVTAKDRDPDTVMDQFKAWCTRKLKEAECAPNSRKHWWTERGSTRFINDETSLEGAILYVRDAQ